MDKIILANKLWVPSNLVNNQMLQDWTYEWTEARYELKENEYGEVEEDQYGNPVKELKTEFKQIKTYRERVLPDGSTYVEFPRGNLKKLQRLLTRSHEDRRPLSCIGYKLKLSQKVLTDHRWPDQKRCAEEYLKKGYGIIKGDTGSGKTVIGIAVACKLGLTALIISTMTDGIKQWIAAFQEHTNILEIEKENNIELIGAYKSTKKRKLFPITVATVQAFESPAGIEFIKQHRNDFSFLLVDEVHDFGAPVAALTIQSINAFAILGLTATVEREDNKHYIVFDIIGPVVAVGTAKQMPPTVYFIGTGVTAPGWIYNKNYPPHYQWTVVMNCLAKSEERYDTIKKFLYADIDSGRTVLIMGERREIIKNVYKRLIQDGYTAEYVDGEVKAEARAKIYKEIRSGRCKVLCAGKVLKAMVDLPNIDCLHFVTPLSSKPRTTQIYGRARRWLENKRNPVIRDYVDGAGQQGQLTGAYKNRLAMCKSNNWDVKLINIENTQEEGVGKWRRRHEQLYLNER